MKKKIGFNFFLFMLLALVFFCNGQNVCAEEQIKTYDGTLGYSYSSSSTEFKIWSSTASEIKVIVEGEIFNNGVKEQSLDKDETNNVWFGSVGGDLSGYEYSFYIKHEDGTVYENVLDPYGKYLNADKTKNYIYSDLVISSDTWNEVKELSIVDKSKIIYGLNIDTFANHSTWNGDEENKGKLLSISQSGTRYNNIHTGFDHIKNLGVTYVEISNLIENESPFVVNGKYVSGEDGYSGASELRKVVSSYYYENIGIIIDFDFKKAAISMLENLNKVDKEYFVKEGNLDFEKEMVKKYIKDTLVYWAATYKLSGVKLSNMSIFDYSYVNELTAALRAVNSKMVIYGDGSYSEANELKAGENNLPKLNHMAMENKSLNYALFGNLADKDTKGILGDSFNEKSIESLKFTFLSGADNGEIDYSLVDGISYKADWSATSSFQVVNYLGSKEGLSVYDKLKINNLTGNRIDQKMVLAFGTLMISGGIPYIEAGNEFLASFRNFDNNQDSVCTGSTCFFSVASKKVIDWSFAYDNDDSVNAFRSLVNFRKVDTEVVQTEADVLGKRMEFYIGDTGNIGFKRNYPGAYVDDTQNVLVLFNYSNQEYMIDDYDEDGWKGLYNYNLSNRDGDIINMKPLSIYITKQIRPPVVSQWVLLVIVVAVIGLLYYANIYLNKRLVEKHGYDITDINKKYRPFINKKKIEEQNSETQEPIVVDNVVTEEQQSDKKTKEE